METGEIDDLLARYESAEKRISANLVELDAHPTYTMLTAGPLHGQTAAKYGRAMKQAPQLWVWLSTLQSAVRKARAVRDDGRMNADRRKHLAALLVEPSVILAQSTTPVAERGLLDDGHVELKVTIEQLLTRMRSTYEPIRDAVAEIDGVWRDVLPRLDAASTTLDRLQRTAQRLQVTEPALTTAIRTRDELRSAVANDPASVGKDRGSELDVLVATAADRIAAAQRGFEDLDADLAGIESRLAEIRVLRARAEATYVECAKKIVDPQGLIRPPTVDAVDGAAGLAQRADELLTLDGPWLNTRRKLDVFVEQCERLRQQLVRAEEANRVPLERRSELRGLLAAYWVKAAAVGRAEDAALTELHDIAHNELYTAPANLEVAAQVVADLGAGMRSSVQ